MNLRFYNFYKCDRYNDYLHPFIIHSMYCGYVVGSNATYNKPMEMFENMIGYATYGLIFGIFYPFTYPAYAVYILYKNLKYIKN